NYRLPARRHERPPPPQGSIPHRRVPRLRPGILQVPDGPLRARGPGPLPAARELGALPDRRGDRGALVLRREGADVLQPEEHRAHPRKPRGVRARLPLHQHDRGDPPPRLPVDGGGHVVLGLAQREDRRGADRHRLRVQGRPGPAAAALLMEIFHNLAFGFEHALTMQNLMFCAIGCVVGTLVGLLPGLGPLATISLLLPLTYSIPTTGA